ncbi:MAG: glycosyltransferase [Endomicrobia bacterium]|nr:glycosyltransferase [Endomicrobiia bacterium]MCL2799361.1 glycosyltransferase [Endomicrobiia bacterium]
MSKITIILPVYNTEKYLNQCLTSIQNQTFKDFECICVNDGSTDNSLSILQEYAYKDERFKIVSQSNKGLSGARNAGLRHVCGEYVSFIDSDDWVSENYLETLYKAALSDNADIVRASYKFYYHEKNSYEPARIRKIHKINDAGSKLERVSKGYGGAFVWGKLFKTKLLEDNNISFYEGKVSEDCPFMAIAFLYAKGISFINDEIYFYRKQVLSITTRSSEKLDADALYNFITLTKDLDKRGFTDRELMRFYFNTFFYKLGKIGKTASKNTQKELLPVTTQHLLYLKMLAKKYGSKGLIIKCAIINLLFMIFGKSFFKGIRVLKNIAI